MTRIVVVDNDGQFTHLEQRALRDIGVDTAIVDNTVPAERIDADGLVLSGGPHSATPQRATRYLDLEIPILGICLGMQDLAVALGGSVGPGEYGGYADVTVEIETSNDPLLGDYYPETRVWASHADEVKTLPDGFERTAHSEICGIEAMSNTERNWYGVQWHPEVAHTDRGALVFENFRSICEH